MKGRVDREMIFEALEFFRRAPGFSKETINVRTEHRAGMVKAKDRIESTAFEFSLAGDATPPPSKYYMF